MNKPFLFRYEDPEAFRLIFQEGVQYALPTGYKNYNCCWDANISPEGEFYFALGSEVGEGNFGLLNHYNRAENRIETCFNSGDYVCTPKNAMVGTKLHSCINFLPDGRIMCNNHTTGKAPQHPGFLPWTFHSHIWEGFMGSTLFIYDPKTGKVESRGIIQPHETMYSGVFSVKHNAYYCIGCLNGHLYKYDFNVHETHDLGKIVENNCYWLHIGPDDNVYACSPNGFLMRLLTDTDTLEWTGHRLERPRSSPHTHRHERYVNTYLDLDSHRMLLVSGLCNRLYEYDCTANTLKYYGELYGADEFYAEMGCEIYDFCADLDADGVLWYSIDPLPDYSERYARQTTPTAAYLFRWDYRNPEASPECMGVVGVPGLTVGLVSEMKIDRKRDLLYMVSAADMENGPPVFCLELDKQRKNVTAKGPIQSDERHIPKPREPKKPTMGAFEGASLENNHEAFSSENVKIVRLWTSAPNDAENTAVRGLYWKDSRTVRGICGKDAPKYVFTIRDGQLIAFGDFSALPASEQTELLAHCCLPVEKIPDGVKLPHVTGRQYLAVPACDTAWNGGRRLIGTKDGKLALRDGTTVRSYGALDSAGPVRALCSNAAGDFAYGAVGSERDFSKIFTFDEKHGVQELGFLLWKNPGWDSWLMSDLVSSLALSADGHQLAIGTEDWISAVYLVQV